MTSAQAQILLRLLDTVVLIATAAPELRARYARRRDIVARILSEQREPTMEEWAALDAELADLTARLDAAAGG